MEESSEVAMHAILGERKRNDWCVGCLLLRTAIRGRSPRERMGPLIGPPPPYQRLEVYDHLTVPDTPRSCHNPLLLYLCTYGVTEHILWPLLCAFHPLCDQNPDLLSAAVGCLDALAKTAFSIVDIARKIRSEHRERLQSRRRVSLQSSRKSRRETSSLSGFCLPLTLSLLRVMDPRLHISIFYAGPSI